MSGLGYVRARVSGGSGVRWLGSGGAGLVELSAAEIPDVVSVLNLSLVMLSFLQWFINGFRAGCLEVVRDLVMSGVRPKS